VLRVLLYLLAAVALGLMITLGPLVALAGIRAESSPNPFASIPKQMNYFERSSGLVTSRDPAGDLNLLAISFVAASIVYMVVRRGSSRKEYPND